MAVGLFFGISRINYLLFHSISESVSFTIAFGIFVVTWHTRKVTANNFYLIIGVGYLFIGVLDFFHLLSFKGMGVFSPDNGNSATQFWIAARTLETLTLLTSTFFIKRAVKMSLVFPFYVTYFLIVFLSIHVFKTFPVCLDENGLTFFKVAMEYILALLLGLCLIRFFIYRSAFHKQVLGLLQLSVASLILTGMSFTLYRDPFGFFNMLGHIFELISFALVYRSLIAIRLEQPYNVLFKELKKSQQELIESRNELENRVHQRTAELEDVNRALKSQIEERLMQEQRLLQSEERFRVALKNSRIAVTHSDRELRYTWIHSDDPDFGGNNWIGKTDLELGDQDLFKVLWEVKSNVMSGKAGINREVMIRKGGQSNHFEITAEPLRDAEGMISGVTTAVLDITERKRTEERLRVRHNTLEAVYAIATTFSASSESLFDQIVLSIARILECSFSSIGRIRGDRIQTVSTYAKGDFFHHGDFPLNCSPCGLVHLRKESVQCCGELKKSFPDNECILGKKGFSSYLGVPVLNNQGDILGVICVLDDQQKKFSSEEVHAVEIFAGYVAKEFEREQIQEELLHSREMQLLGRLTSGVAHEVRNPLNALIAVTEALFQDLENKDDFLVYKEHIRTQVDRLSRLMQDLLEMGRPFDESRRMRVNLSELILSTVQLWNSSAPRNHSVLTDFSPGAETAAVNGDFSKLQQVLINLLDNASQHSPEGSRITVRLDFTSGTVVIGVTDQGCGIDKEVMGRMFEPFFTTRKKGTGLGLCIVKQIVELHGGTIVAQNNLADSGAIMKICLPCEMVEENIQKTAEVAI